MITRILLTVLIGGLSSGFVAPVAMAETATSQEEAAEAPTPDPLEPFNQKMFWFNLRLDEYVLRPVATVYDRVLPNAAQRGVQRFFKNLGVVERFANNLHLGRRGIL